MGTFYIRRRDDGPEVSDYLIFSARFNKWGDGFGFFATEEWLKHVIIVGWITGR